MVVKVFESDPNPIKNLAKDYALSEAAGGVPLGEQQALVGAAASLRYLATTSSILGGGWTRATLFGSAVQGNDDILVLTASGQRYAIDRERFLSLSPAHAAGDDLVVDDLLGSGTASVRSITSDDGTHAVLIARTSDNRPLWQEASTGDTVEAGDVVQVYAEEWRGGIIGQRYNELRGATRSVVAVQQRSNLIPIDDPPATTTFDGRTARNAGSWSALDEPDPAGTDTLYWAVSEVHYDYDSARFIFDDWNQVRVGDAFDLQFATSQYGPWHTARAADDSWARDRQDDGTWRVFQFDTALSSHRARTWTYYCGTIIPANAGTAGPWAVSLLQAMDMADLQWVELRFRRAADAGSSIALTIPAHLIQVKRASVVTSPPAVSIETWRCSWDPGVRSANVALQIAENTTGKGNTYRQTASIDFFYVANADVAGAPAQFISIRNLGSDSNSGTLEVWAI